MSVSETTVNRTTRDFDIAGLIQHLDGLSLNETDLAKLHGLLLRTEFFVVKRLDDEPRGTHRDTFLSDLLAYLKARGISEAAEYDFSRVASLFDLCDYGYGIILRALSKNNSLMEETAALRLSATLVGAMEECDTILAALTASLQHRTFHDHRMPIQVNTDGPTVFADSSLSALLLGLTSALMREGYASSLWDQNGVLRIPSLTLTSTQQRDMGRGIVQGALYWQQWERFERRLRYQRGDLQNVPPEEWPADAPPDGELLLRYKPTPIESTLMLHFAAAEERLTARLFENMMRLAATGLEKQLLCNVHSNPALPPAAFISAQEFIAYDSLTDLLAIDLSQHVSLHDGLRAVEWLRGYSALKVLAEERTAGAADGSSRLFQISHDDLLAYLTSAGLQNDKALSFLNAARFRRNSKDIWDSPLITVADADSIADQYILVGPAAEGAHLILVVLSALSRSSNFFKSKGPGFETATRAFLNSVGFTASGLHFFRDGEEYEVDAVFEFDDAIILLECKNRSVPTTDPIDLFYFRLELGTQRRQVDRLVAALQRYPEELERALGAGASAKPIIPIVLFSQPYAMPKSHSTPVYLDFGALRRFFTGRDLSVNQSVRTKDTTLTAPTTVYRMWDGERPTLLDFERYLADLPQLKAALAHLELVEVVTMNAEGLMAIGPAVHRVEATTESVARALSDDPEGIMNDIALARAVLEAAIDDDGA